MWSILGMSCAELGANYCIKRYAESEKKMLLLLGVLLYMIMVYKSYDACKHHMARSCCDSRSSFWIFSTRRTVRTPCSIHRYISRCFGSYMCKLQGC